ncbi:hypothetical protein RRF57_004062 [Xylaria bambusicola]|uniref:Uncharacterized protein n=1 Tax=Xylaria bambusicola TaxID=326684 RepID=A0AAN7UHC4_9PEZI
MASSINIDAPGAYPATPGSEEPMQQAQSSSRNYTKETPRNMGDDVHSSGHHFKASGIYADESTLSGESTKPGVMTGAYSRVAPKDSSSATNNNYTFGSNGNNNVANNSSILNDRNSSKFSEPSTRGTGLHQFEAAEALDTLTNVVPPANTPLGDVNNTNSGINTTTNARGYAPEDHNKVQASLRGKSSTNHTEPYWGSIPFGTGVYNGVAGHGSDETATHQHHNGASGYGIAPVTQQRSLDDTGNNGPMQSGVYNGVTGHGSNPAATHERSLDDSISNRPMSTGVYNGVVGHGSNESISPRTSRFGEDLTTDDSSRHQGALPLTSTADSRTDAKYKDTNENKKDSHYKEALAGAGAAWAGGYAANEYSKRDRTNESKTTDQKYKEENPKQKDQTKTYAAAESRHHKHKESTPPTTQPKRDQTLKRRQPPAMENREKKADDLEPGYYGAAAAGAGASAYGMHKYANRDSARDQLFEQNRGLETQKPLGTFNGGKATDSTRGYYGAAAPIAHQSEKNEISEPQQSFSSYNNVNTTGDSARDTYGAAPLARQSKSDVLSTQHSRYNKLSDGTDSGTAPDAQQTTTLPIRTQKPGSSAREQQPQYNRLSDETNSCVTRGEPFASSLGNTEDERRGVVAPISTDIPSTTAHSKTQDTGRSPSDSSHGGQYNVLSSGTSSGINLETNEHARFHCH